MSPPISLWDPLPHGVIAEHELAELQPAVTAAHKQLVEKSGPGAEFLGWLDLPKEVAVQVPRIKALAELIRATAPNLVVVGVGGSYLGAKATIDALTGPFRVLKDSALRVFYAGHTLSGGYLAGLIRYLEKQDFCLAVVSKSGGTIEPAIALRVLRSLLANKYSEAAVRQRIFVVTDPQKGLLKALAEKEGYKTLAIPPDVGGRYSVFSPGGLLPIAAAGIDIEEFLAGAREAMEQYTSPKLYENPCYRYAAYRNILYQAGKQVELFAAYEPSLATFGEWWKQLFGESEGKEGKGLFPATAIFSTDLHSLGQYIQEGPRLLFETVLRIKAPDRRLRIPLAPTADDGLNYLAGRDIEEVNTCAFKGTLTAHTDTGVPNLILELPKLSPCSLGALFYFMEKACAISAYLLAVNPFNQPGVEAYKKQMLSLLRD